MKIYGTHSHVGYNIYIKILPTGQTFDISQNTNYEITYKPTLVSDYYVYLYWDNDLLDSTHFVVVSSGAETENPIVSNWNYIIGIVIIVIMLVIGMAFTTHMDNAWLQSERVFTLMIFAFLGVVIDVVYNLLPLWVVILIGLFVATYLAKIIVG